MESDKKHRFIHEILFAGLVNRNTGFDSLFIPHVAPEDFLFVIDRCEETGAGICGVEIFEVSRWEQDHQVDFVGVWIRPEEGLDWARALAREHSHKPAITVCATFNTPEEEAAYRSNPGWKQQDVDLGEAIGGI